MLNFTMFLLWLWKSIYQGSTIMLLGVLLFEESNFTNIVAITFTSLVFTEWLNIVTEIEKWHIMMIISEILSVVCYLLSILVLQEYFDVTFIFSIEFAWKVLVITLASWGPIHIIKLIMDKINPPEHTKVRNKYLSPN
jgi:phospholipid-translocating ATPase